MITLLLSALVKLYQFTVRPILGPNCRFTPSCSDYALQALRAHGALQGGRLAAWRVLRCNPWCACGYDPVPPTPPCTTPLACHPIPPEAI